MSATRPEPYLRSIPERRPISMGKKGIWLRIDHAHIARVLAIRADREGEVA